ncbi:MAG: hypothetical protein KBC96_06000 [Armatimonadetes bacterium]|nr:hypothetical protein [Armatimonadota bacterium]
MEISLNGSDWKIKHFNPGEARGKQPFAPGYDMSWWTDATVPGAVQADLLRAGLIPDPYQDLNSRLIEWVAAREWACTKAFTINPIPEGMRVGLRFEGIDYSGDVYLNGAHLGRSENMFVPAEFDVTGILDGERENRIVVILDPAPAEYGQIGRTSGVRTYKTRMSYGWDFAPRLIPLGLWDDVKLVVTGGARIEDSWANSELSDDLKSANLMMRTKVRSERPMRVTVQTRILLEDAQVAGQSEVVRVSGLAEVSQLFAVKNPRLWWPNGHGDPNLYFAEVLVVSEDGVELDRREFHFGFKRVRLVPNPGLDEGLLPWNFEVNGKRIYLKGWNWVPADSMYGTVTAERYERLVRLAKEANVNLLRVWGGGLIEKDEFYAACDRLGIMVWQEFILSSSGLDNDPPNDPAYLNMIRRAAENIIPRRRNRACHAVWCGGNELTWKGRDDEALRTMREAVEVLDPQKIYLPTSPMRTFEEGEPLEIDIHGDWQYFGPEKHYEINNARRSAFHSEFGCEGAANIETIREVLKHSDPTPISPRNELWAHRGEWWINTGVLEEIFGPLPDVETFARMSRFVQWEGLRYAVEQNRRRKYASGGTIPWQFNEPWPNLTCTNAVDYFLRPKPAYYAVKSAYEPVHVSAKYDRLGWKPGEEFRAQLWANNSGPALRDCAVVWTIVGTEGDVFLSGGERLDLAENAAVIAGDVSWRIEPGFERLFVLEARLVGPGGEELSRNSYLMSANPPPIFDRLLALPPTTIEVEQGKAVGLEDGHAEVPVTVRNTGGNYAFFVKVTTDCPGWGAYYGRNYLLIAPGDSETVVVKCVPRERGAKAPGPFTAEGWNTGPAHRE